MRTTAASLTSTPSRLAAAAAMPNFPCGLSASRTPRGFASKFFVRYAYGMVVVVLSESDGSSIPFNCGSEAVHNDSFKSPKLPQARRDAPGGYRQKTYVHDGPNWPVLDCCSLPISPWSVARSRFAAQLPHAASAGAGAVAGAVWRSRSVCRTPECVYEAL